MTLNWILILFTLTSCAVFKPDPVPVDSRTPGQKRQQKIDECVHKFIDKGVKFLDASKECADRIYEKVEV